MSSIHSYTPIEEDELFRLDQPTNGEYILFLPKEGEALVECQDRFALNAAGGRYAIADGVSGSFAPGPWARIVACNFVEHAYTPLTIQAYKQADSEQKTTYGFGTRLQFEHWLHQCRDQWYTWMRERWVPTMHALSELRGNELVDWEFEIEQGAQTTLTGCWLFPSSSGTHINIFASVIGDSEFFLFRQDKAGTWRNITAFPFTSTDQFDAHPLVLATRPQAQLVERVWHGYQEGVVTALPGDRIMLATDTLAKWILMQLEQHMTTWTQLLDSTDTTLHEQMLRQELHANQMEDDDLTMLVISVAEL